MSEFEALILVTGTRLLMAQVCFPIFPSSGTASVIGDHAVSIVPAPDWLQSTHFLNSFTVSLLELSATPRGSLLL